MINKHSTSILLQDFLEGMPFSEDGIVYKPLTIITCKHPIRSLSCLEHTLLDNNMYSVSNTIVPKLYWEKPEKKLNEKSQTIFANKLMSWVNNKIILVLETDSVHIFNTIRLHVKKGNILHTDVSINFIDFGNSNNTYFKSTLLNIDEHGRLDNWPDGFLDTYEKILADLL